MGLILGNSRRIVVVVGENLGVSIQHSVIGLRDGIVCIVIVDDLDIGFCRCFPVFHLQSFSFILSLTFCHMAFQYSHHAQ